MYSRRPPSRWQLWFRAKRPKRSTTTFVRRKPRADGVAALRRPWRLKIATYFSRLHLRFRKELVRAKEDAEMKQMDAVRQLSLAAAVALMGGLALSGCKADRPDEKPAVINALVNGSLFSVTVAEDRHDGVITLSGDVATNDS